MRITRSDLDALAKSVKDRPRVRKPRPRLERDIQVEILRFLRTVPGVVAWKAGAGAFRVGDRYVKMGHKGVSDIVGWKTLDVSRRTQRAVFLAVEVKRPGARATEHQMAFLDIVAHAGGIAILASSVDEVRRGLGL